MDLEREAEIEKDWITVKNYEFKILVMIAVLAENKLAFRGKIKDMCDFLGVSNQKYNTDKIKEAITALEANGDILTIKEGHTWTLTLSRKAERKPKVIKIRNAWIKAIQEYKASSKQDYVAWENILKVLVYLCADKRDIKRYDTIAADLGLSIDVVKRSFTALMAIEFTGLDIKKKLAWIKLEENQKVEYRVVGQKVDVILTFDD